MVAGESDAKTGSSLGPLWVRTLSIGNEESVTAELTKVLARYGARRMVVGHTVTRGGIVTRAGGRLVRIDVGMSSYYGGRPAGLIIEKGIAYAVDADGRKRKLATPPVATRPADSRPAPARRPTASRGMGVSPMPRGGDYLSLATLKCTPTGPSIRFFSASFTRRRQNGSAGFTATLTVTLLWTPVAA